VEASTEIFWDVKEEVGGVSKKILNLKKMEYQKTFDVL